jgi:L-iditol 2-dehydrogenase
VRGFKVGDRVVGSYVASCGTCRYCVLGKPQLCEYRILFGLNFDGAFAQYMKVPRANRTLVKVPDEMDLKTAVLIPDMFLTALYAVERGGIGPDSSVLITGLGSVGLSIVAAARSAGARMIIGVVRRARPRPIEFAKRMGVTHVINTAEEKDVIGRIRGLTGGLGVDVSFEASGAPSAVELALNALGPCGNHVQVGIVGEPLPLDLRYLTSLEKTIIGVLNPGSTIHINRAIDVVRSHGIDLKELVTHEFSLEDVNDALEAAEKKVGDPIKIVLKIA